MNKRVTCLSSWFPQNEKDIRGSFFLEQFNELNTAYNLDVFVVNQVHFKVFKFSRLINPEVKIIKGVKFVSIDTVGSERFLFLSMIAWLIGFAFIYKKIKISLKKTNLLHINSMKWAGLSVLFFCVPIFLVEHAGYFMGDFSKKPFSKFLFKKIAKKITYLAAVSKQLARDLKHSLDVNVRFILPNPISDEFHFINTTGERNIDILFVCQLRKIKRVSETLEYLSDFILKNKLKVVIVGNGSEFFSIKEVVFRNNLEEYVSLLGEKPRSKIVEIMNDSKMFILNSLRETFGIVALEAGACGCVPIVNSYCGVSEVIGADNVGFVFDGYEPDTQILFGALESSNNKRKLISKAVLKDYSMISFRKKITGIYSYLRGEVNEISY